MKAMFRIYYSPLETKFKLVFDMYDFDGDGVISKEDVHLVLSHIPMSVIKNIYSYYL
jgi:Ca2+-binding EF-hand superfamily protein